jgi:hypothetical protein
MPGIVAVPRSQAQAKARGSDSGDKSGAGEVHHRPCGAGGRHGRLRLPAPAVTCLAPEIVEAILDGRQPKGLRLAEMMGSGPLAWEEQRGGWGWNNAALTQVRLAGPWPLLDPAYRSLR